MNNKEQRMMTDRPLSSYASNLFANLKPNDSKDNSLSFLRKTCEPSSKNEIFSTMRKNSQYEKFSQQNGPKTTTNKLNSDFLHVQGEKRQFNKRKLSTNEYDQKLQQYQNTTKEIEVLYKEYKELKEKKEKLKYNNTDYKINLKVEVNKNIINSPESDYPKSATLKRFEALGSHLPEKNLITLGVNFQDKVQALSPTAIHRKYEESNDKWLKPSASSYCMLQTQDNTPKKDDQINMKKVYSAIEKPLLMNKNVTDFKSGKNLADVKLTDFKSQVKLTEVKQTDFKSQVKLTDFKLGKNLGEGKFGTVFQAIHKQSNALFALKRVKKSMIKTHMLEQQFMMEIKMQFFFDHPNILRLFGVFHDPENIFLILEYMEEGTLYSKLKKSANSKLSEPDTANIMKDILESIKYLHHHDIAHRDIKPQNIVISHGVHKICDFGWSALCVDDRRSTMCGTLDYSAPQILQGKQYGRSIDLWCLGVLCYELLMGKAPFYHISRKETMKKIMNAVFEELNIPSTMSSEAKDFIMKLLMKNPEERMDTEEALKHSFILSHLKSEL